MSTLRTLLLSGGHGGGGGTLPQLVTAGQFLRYPDGTKFTVIECSDFNLLNRYQHGEDITPILRQRRDLGFNFLRVWTLYDAGTGAGDFQDIDYAKVGPFLDLVAGYGFYVDIDAYAGALTYRQDHYGQLCAAIQGKTNVYLSIANERDIPNNNIPDIFGPCPNIPTSWGSMSSQTWPPQHDEFQWYELHTNDADEWWRKNGHNAMEIADAYHQGVVTTEATRAPDKDSNPNHYYDAAAGAALLCRGSCFHSLSGKTSDLFAGVELDCAKAHCDGAHSVDLRCQDGTYAHEGGLEGPDDLRVYSKTLGGDEVIVHIRK